MHVPKGFALCFIALLVSCGPPSDSPTEDPSGSDLPEIPPQKAIDEYQYTLTAGTINLAMRSGCVACHYVDTALIGPPWKAVSLRYMNYAPALDYLTDKVLYGGENNWGDMPMPPFSTRAVEDAIRGLLARILAGEGHITELTVDQPMNGLALSGETDTFQFLATAQRSYVVTLHSTSGDSDIFAYDPFLSTGDRMLIASSEVRDGVDIIEIPMYSDNKFYEIEVVGHSDSEYEISLAELPAYPPIPTADELAAYDYSLSADTLSLATASGCQACHGVDTVVVGPSFKAVSLRFKDVPNSSSRLFEKVKNGGRGVWGDAAMPPYSPRASDAEIELLVNAILSGG